MRERTLENGSRSRLKKTKTLLGLCRKAMGSQAWASMTGFREKELEALLEQLNSVDAKAERSSSGGGADNNNSVVTASLRGRIGGSVHRHTSEAPFSHFFYRAEGVSPPNSLLRSVLDSIKVLYEGKGLEVRGPALQEIRRNDGGPCAEFVIASSEDEEGLALWGGNSRAEGGERINLPKGCAAHPKSHTPRALRDPVVGHI